MSENKKALTLDLLFTDYSEFTQAMVTGYVDELLVIKNSTERYVDFPTNQTALFLFLKLKKQLLENGYRFREINNIQEKLFKQVHDLAIESMGEETAVEFAAKDGVELSRIFDDYMIKCMRIRERLLIKLEENIRLYFIDATFDIVDEIVQLRRLLIKDGYNVLSIDLSMLVVMEVIYTEVREKLQRKYKVDKYFLYGGVSFVTALYFVLFVIL